MLDVQQFQLPLEARRAIVVGESAWAIDEMEGLFTTLGGVVASKCLVDLRKIDSRTYVGSGKLEELGKQMEAEEADVLLMDFDLSPSQLKNIEQVVKGLVLDRSGTILEIFSRHARSKEARLQVELARLQYLMPRLPHLWSHFERQKGAGGGALKGKGMGEKQIEVDRRLVKDRISMLRKRIDDADQARELHRKSRDGLLQTALVGYTNAGKSTLLNALTHSEVLVEDALFATLDASVRVLDPKARPAILVIDTVGFIDRLPHNLVASFRSTLSAVLEADLLLHVLDASHPEVQRHYQVTMDVLKELGAQDIPMLLVFNKVDRCKDLQLLKVWSAGLTRGKDVPPSLFISALKPEMVDALRSQVSLYFERGMEVLEVVVPYEDGKTLAQINEVGRIEKQQALEKGTFVRFKTTTMFANKYNFARYRA